MQTSIKERLRVLERQKEAPGEMYFVMGDMHGEASPTEVEALRLRDNDILFVITSPKPCGDDNDTSPCQECRHYPKCLAEMPPDMRKQWIYYDKLEKLYTEGWAWMREYQARLQKEEAQAKALAPVAVVKKEKASPKKKKGKLATQERKGIWPKGW